MTTIATDGKSMAGDGLCTGNGLIHSETAIKVRKLADGRIVGAAGSLYHLSPFAECLQSGGDFPDLDENFEALVLMPDGTCLAYDHKGRFFEQTVPAATGSGSALAIGAMEAGATPQEAVEIACRRDTGSGGSIIAISI